MQIVEKYHLLRRNLRRNMIKVCPQRDLLVFGHESLELCGICASEFVNLLPPFEKLERRHGRNTTSRSDFLAVVHIHFDKGNVGVFRCHLLENWPNHLTRPGGIRQEEKQIKLVVSMTRTSIDPYSCSCK